MITKKMAVLLAALALSGGAGANMTFSGTLNAHACQLHPDDSLLKVDFSEVGTRDLYLRGGTPDEVFRIRLTDCNPAVADSVRVTFDGARSLTVPGALALESSSEAGGVAIVLSDAARNRIALGTPVLLPLGAGSNTLTFYRRLQVEPDAMADEKIISGALTASSTFTLFYP